MNSEPTKLLPLPIFWLSLPLVAAVTWGVHEFAHFQMGRWLGYDMWWSLNQAGLSTGEYKTGAHRMLVAMAGPFATYLQAALAFWLIRARHSSLAYPYLFLALFMRLAASVVGLSSPNDEARTSIDMGLPVWALPAVVVVILFGMTIAASRTLHVGWRTNLLLYLVFSVITAAIVFADPVVGRFVGR